MVVNFALVWSQLVVADQLISGFFVARHISAEAVLFAGAHGKVVEIQANKQLKLTRIPGAGMVTGLIKSENVYLAVSSDGLIFKNSELMQNSWTRVFEDNQDPLFDIAVIGPRHLLVTGAFGHILESVDNGDSWKSLSDKIKNPDSAHLYKIIRASAGQYQKFGVKALVVGEFGSVFSLKKDKKSDGLSWHKVKNSADFTLFDGYALSDRWMILAGVSGGLLAYDLSHNKSYLTKLCESVSVFGISPDSTGRNLVLAGDRNMLLRLSILDDGETAPPPLTCQTLTVGYNALTGVDLVGDQVYVTTENGVYLESGVDLMPNFSAPVDIKWVDADQYE